MRNNFVTGGRERLAFVRYARGPVAFGVRDLLLRFEDICLAEATTTNPNTGADPRQIVAAAPYHFLEAVSEADQVRAFARYWKWYGRYLKDEDGSMHADFREALRSIMLPDDRQGQRRAAA
jgi:hypothetical protein